MSEVEKKQELTESEKMLIEAWKKRSVENSHGLNFEVKDGKLSLSHDKCSNELLNAEFYLISGVIKSSTALRLLDRTALSITEDNMDLSGICGSVNLIFDLLIEMKPTDIFETMLCLRLISLHFLSGKELSRAGASTTMSYTDQYIGRATKLIRLWNETKACLDKHRRKEDQTVRVEHVHVHNGGRAIVGNLSSERGGS